jgi:hypothetical protein
VACRALPAEIWAEIDLVVLADSEFAADHRPDPESASLSFLRRKESLLMNY